MHVTLDGSRRVTLPYASIIDADRLISQLSIHHVRSDIRIQSVTGADWQINLRKCYELLLKLPWKRGTRRLALDDLVHNRQMNVAAWLDCMVPGKLESDFVS